jgi:parvulin-like peptidyl-prolyl isomerase
MIQDEVVIHEEALLAAWDARHGPRRIGRVFVSPDITACTSALEKVNTGVPFSEVAAQGSTDASAATGGLIDPVSRLDPSWPTSFRDALWSLEPGATSSPVLVDGEYVLVHFITLQPGDGVDFTSGRKEAADTVRRAQERLLMDATAKRLLESTQVDIIDTEFGRAWRNDPGAITSSSLPSARTPGE